MSKKGGYQIIDLHGKNFVGSTSFEIPGIYDLIEGTNKTIMVSGLVIDGVEQHNEFATVNVVGSSYNLIIQDGGQTIVVSDTDVVHIE